VVEVKRLPQAEHLLFQQELLRLKLLLLAVAAAVMVALLAAAVLELQFLI
jgi:hypothetical protein